MNKISKIAALFLASGLTFSASAAIDLTKLPPPSTKTGLTYTNDIRPIFQAACFRCHGGSQHRGGISLETLDNVLQGGEDGSIVTAGDSTKSQLVIAISQLDPKSAMPPKRRGRPPGGQAGPGGPPPGGPGMAEGGPGPGPGGPGPGSAGGPPGEMGTNGPAGGPPRRPQGPPAKPLTAEQVGLVRAWIDQGAK